MSDTLLRSGANSASTRPLGEGALPLGRSLRAVVGTALVGLALATTAMPLRAQTTSASVFGSVKDSVGGMLPGATVTLTSRTQGRTLATTSDDQGRFVFPIVRPDAYTLRVGRQGFKTAERTGVVVSANDKFSAGVVTLDVGGIEESVSVSGRVSELQAASGERSWALESEAIQNIANNGRSPFGFAALVPGILQQGPSGTPPEDAAGFTVNGQRPNSNNVTIDGVANIDTGNNGANMATTNIDAVAELKILTSSYQAEYGRAVGGQVQIVTKSGTQSFHGSGYWYGRRSDWNANSWTNKRAAAPRPVGNGKLIELPDASRNDFGYTIGGPAFIPGVFNEDKKKLFFFWSQEFQRRKDSVSERLSRVPTALERAGDFSGSVDNNGNPWPYIRDYATGLPCGPTNTSGCFQDGGVLGRIPSNRLYQPGLNALRIYPDANTAGSSGINYTSQAPTSAPVVKSCCASTTTLRTGGVSRAGTCRSRTRRSSPTATACVGSNNLDTAATTFAIPGWNWMVSATGILSNSTSLELSAWRAPTTRSTSPSATPS